MKLLLFCIGLLALTGYEQEPAAKVYAGNNTVSEIVMDNDVIDNMNCDILSGELPGKTKPILVGDTLVPMEISCEECTDPYTKYGFAFDANCYSCNGIDISVTDSVVYLIGFFAEDLQSKAFRIEKKEIAAKDTIVITVKDAKFIFNKVDKAEIYKLVIEGDLKFEADDPMVRNYFLQLQDFYYAPRKELQKFAVHDCGDFDG